MDVNLLKLSEHGQNKLHEFLQTVKDNRFVCKIFFTCGQLRDKSFYYMIHQYLWMKKYYTCTKRYGYNSYKLMQITTLYHSSTVLSEKSAWNFND